MRGRRIFFLNYDKNKIIGNKLGTPVTVNIHLNNLVIMIILKFIINRVVIVIWFLIIGMRLQAQSPNIEGGVFVPHNGGYEGVIGQSRIFFDQVAGGVMSFHSQKNIRKEVARLDMVFTIYDKQSGSRIEARQSFDKSPKILFLEEGNDRIGLRVLFKLYDRRNSYCGHGMTETWIYPDGQVFITASAMFENIPTGSEVNVGKMEINIPRELMIAANKSQPIPVNDATMPGRYKVLTKADPKAGLPSLALFWRTGRLEHDTYISRSLFGEEGAPSYYRWPDYFRQAYVEPVVTGRDFLRWPIGRGVYIENITINDKGAQLNWPIDPKQPKDRPSFNTLFRLALINDGDASKAAKTFVETEREQVKMNVSGGMIHGNEKAKDDKGYNDQEGCYEIRKTGPGPMIITLPADNLQRTIRIKAIALTQHGAVAVSLDGKPLIPQLTTDGGIADDPLAPITEEPEGPANAAMVTVQLTSKPQTLTFREEEGIQLVYQTRSPRREYAIYSTKTGPRWSGVRFSLVDGHARNMRAYGNQNWALTDNLLHWFPDVGYTPEQMLNQLRDFVIIKNGPGEIIFKYTSNNAYDGAQSEFIVSARADAPAMQINVGATFTVLERWPYHSAQFFDVFPFRGVDIRDWWYKDILWVAPGGNWKTEGTVSWKFEGDKNLTQIKGPGFFGLYSSDRGNMLMLTKNFKPVLPTDYVICGNYTDFHMSSLFVDDSHKPLKLEKGFKASVEYELAVWGDEKLTRDQLIEIGNKSLKAGKLIIPSN